MSDKFISRSTQQEFLDSENIQENLLFRNLRELDFLNRVSGGFAISLEGIKKLAKNETKKYHIVDLGCGSGGSLKYFARWARKNGFKIKFTGVDKNKKVINYLEKSCRKFPEIEGVTDDYSHFLNGAEECGHFSLFVVLPSFTE